jgi:hypothetical protein
MLTPGVINIKQLENNTETVSWTLSSRFCPVSETDFTTLDAFLLLQHGDGRTDEVILTSTANADGTVTLTWLIGKHRTWLKGGVKYQIVFREKCRPDLTVIVPNGEAPEHGAYEINNRDVESYYRVWTHKTNKAYTIQYNNRLKRWELLNGGTVVHYQTFSHPEPYGGTWQGILVGNAKAYAWRSAEAVIYISESIAADEEIAAQFPTILRQVFDGMQNICSKSGVTALIDWVYDTYWYGDKAPYFVNLHELFSVPQGCYIVEARVQRENADGTFTDVDSIEVVEVDGIAKLYCNEKIDAKITIAIRSAGGSYVFVDERSVGHVGGWRIDKPGLAAELPDYADEKKGFVFYATDTGMYYFKQSDASGDWAGPFPFRGEQGTPGATGRPGRDGVSEVYVCNAIEGHDESENPHADLFAEKADKVHSHAMSEVSGLAAALAQKATVADVTALTRDIQSINTTLGNVNAALAAIAGE